RAIAEDPLGATNLREWRELLHNAPNDEALKQRIRAADQRQRERYFTQVRRNRSAAWMLAAGTGVFIFSSMRFFSTKRNKPVPRAIASAQQHEQELRRARLALLATGAVVVAGIAAIGFLDRVQ